MVDLSKKGALIETPQPESVLTFEVPTPQNGQTHFALSRNIFLCKVRPIYLIVQQVRAGNFLPHPK